MRDYYFKDKQFVIEQYDKQKTFASFLPGLAGKRGIPLWAFYVNRGQGIASFGIENKDRQILEFSPAVTSYQTVAINGFRTFVKQNGIVSEFFGVQDNLVKRYMFIKRSEFTIKEVNDDLGLTMEATYFGLPNENIAALVRQVRITNHSDQAQELEVLDGISQLLPTGVNQYQIKSMSNLVRSWMEVYHLDQQVGFFRMRSSTTDSAEVVEVKDGHFYLSTVNDSLVQPIVDQSLVFGYDTTKQRARHLEDNALKDIMKEEQITANKIPVGFTPVVQTLQPGESIRINTVIGHIHSDEDLLQRRDALAQSSYLSTQRDVAASVIDELLQDVETKTANPLFDDYIKQNYMDNILRGGYPMVLPGSTDNHVYHLFSRRHGDLERDYNYFSIAPEFYSQGNGSFRDVCQNRRSDILTKPEVGTFNIKMFASFIQADGYNPLSIDGSTFTLNNPDDVKPLVKELFGGSQRMETLLSGKFTPGSIINTVANYNIKISFTDDEIFAKIFPLSSQHFEAHFAEGYWIDHWTYILDLVQNYEAVFPDKIHSALYQDMTYKYFDSPILVMPRDEKTCLTANGDVRRYGSVYHNDNEKVKQLDMNPDVANWLKNEDGDTVTASLFEKLTVLAVNKIACLDPSGMGIEMEANKPGWNDAMNGLPGLFGSGVSETIELKRLVTYLLQHIDLGNRVRFPQEFNQFCFDLEPLLLDELSPFDYWDQANTVKERYREAIRYGTKGVDVMDSYFVKHLLEAMDEQLDQALGKAYTFGKGIYPTYLVHTVTEYEELLEKGKPRIGYYGLPVVKAKAFEVRRLPYYLEGPARALKIMDNMDEKQTMYQLIKQSNIYDHELKFYKTSEFLDDESNEIGRGRSFTKGWQERESNFLHMTYKYLVGLLKAGMYDAFFEEIKTNLTIFMDPKVYGRSTLENSSFIASSINPDPFVRGQGYVARLSGSTAEMISIWSLMMTGGHPFTVIDDELTLTLHPILTKEFFQEGTVEFTLLGKVKVTYVNQSNIDTFDPTFAIKSYEIDGKQYSTVTGELAKRIRRGDIRAITIVF